MKSPCHCTLNLLTFLHRTTRISVMRAVCIFSDPLLFLFYSDLLALVPTRIKATLPPVASSFLYSAVCFFVRFIS